MDAVKQCDSDIVLRWRCVTNESLWPPLLLNRSVQPGWEGGAEGAREVDGGWVP